MILPVALIVGLISGAFNSARQGQLASQAKSDAEAKALGIRMYFDNLRDFKITHRWFGRDLNRSIALDEESGLICMVDSSAVPIHHGTYFAADLLEAAIYQLRTFTLMRSSTNG